MKTHFDECEFKYDGSQLSGLFAYMNYGVLGDSIVSWIGACDVTREHMADGEDLRAGAAIRGDRMVHFIIEKFNADLFGGAVLQRLMATIVMDVLKEMTADGAGSARAEPVIRLRRDGDDIYLDGAKLSISIATRSHNSTLVHFAVNVVNEGTPVKTLCLEELGVQPVPFAKRVCDKVASECRSMVDATMKVRGVNSIGY